MLKWIVTIGAAVAGAIALFASYSFVSFRPLTRDDFTTVQGTVRQTSELQGQSGPYLEIYLQESPLRFRVPIDAYQTPFKKDEYRRNVHAGSPIILDVQSAVLRKPVTPPSDSIPTVFVDGIRDEHTIYYDVEDRMRWLESNHWNALFVGAGFVVVTIVLVLVRRSYFT